MRSFSRYAWIFLLPGLACAQLRAQNAFITMDFRNCGMGLKDSTGKWLCEPIYESIRELDGGYFVANLGMNEGVLRSDGSVALPVMYDDIRSQQVVKGDTITTVFMVEKQKRCGVVDERNNVLIPLQYLGISVYRDGTIIARTSKKRFSVLSFDGKNLPLPGRYVKPPALIAPHLLKVRQNRFGVSTYYKYKRPWFKRRRTRTHRSYAHTRLCFKRRNGLITDSGQTVLPTKYCAIDYERSTYDVICAQTKRHKTYFRLDGSVLGPEKLKGHADGKDHRWNSNLGSYWSLIENGYSVERIGRKNGMIGVNGDTILPFVYEHIYPVNYYKKRICFARANGTTGIFDPVTRSWLLPPQYEMLDNIGMYDTPDSTKPAWVLLAMRDNKFGIITSEGQELVPFVYSQYHHVYGENRFLLYSENSYMVVTIPTLYAAGYAVTRFPAGKMLEKKMQPDGSIAWINPELVNDSAQLSVYDTSRHHHVNPVNYGMLLHACVLTVQPLGNSDIIPGIGPVFTMSSPYINLVNGEKAGRYCISHDKNRINMDEVSPVGSDSSFTYYMVDNSGGIFRSDGKVLLRPGSYDYAYVWRGNRDILFNVDCGRKKEGLMDGNGRFVLDTAWHDVGPMRGNTVWVISPSRRARKRYYRWNILDTTTNTLLLPRKGCSSRNEPFGDGCAIIARPGGNALYSTTLRKYIAEENINNIMPLDSSNHWYAVRTCRGHIGIVDGNGTWLADTTWTTLIKAPAGNEPSFRPSYDGHHTFAVLSNDTGLLIFNGRTGTVTRDPAMKTELLENAFSAGELKIPFNSMTDAWHYPSIALRDSVRDWKTLPAWEQTLLFDSLFTGEHFVADTVYRNYVSLCNRCRKSYPAGRFAGYTWAKNYDTKYLLHHVELANDSCISVGRTTLLYKKSADNSPRDLFFTALLFPDGPRAMLLDSLFTGTEWRAFITNEVLGYLDTHVNVSGNCSNPYMLPFVMRNRFLLTPEGLLLFPPGYSENDLQLSILLRWETLTPYLRTDVKSKLGLK